MKKDTRKLVLLKSTVRDLAPNTLARVHGGGADGDLGVLEPMPDAHTDTEVSRITVVRTKLQ